MHALVMLDSTLRTLGGLHVRATETGHLSDSLGPFKLGP